MKGARRAPPLTMCNSLFVFDAPKAFSCQKTCCCEPLKPLKKNMLLRTVKTVKKNMLLRTVKVCLLSKHGFFLLLLQVRLRVTLVMERSELS